jgi:hypothetical protein
MTATKATNFIGKAERLSPGRAGPAAATCSSSSAGEGAVTALGGRASVGRDVGRERGRCCGKGERVRRGGGGESMRRCHRHRTSELYTGLIPGVSLVDSRPLPENDTWPRGNDPKSRLIAVLKMMMAGRHPNAEKRGQHRRCLVIGRIRFLVLKQYL